MKLIFPANLYKKMRAYVEGIDYEISGLGKVKVVGNDIIVEDLKIFRQVVTGGNTVLDKKALGKFWDELVQKNEDLSCWRFWWHSHFDMTAFWSGLDIETIEDFDTEKPIDNWCVSFVTNHKAETKVRIDIFQPLRCTIEDVPWDILIEAQDKDITEKALDEITEKVEIITYSTRRLKRRSTNWRNFLRGTPIFDENGHPIYHFPVTLSGNKTISIFDKKKKDDQINLLGLGSAHFSLTGN